MRVPFAVLRGSMRYCVRSIVSQPAAISAVSAINRKANLLMASVLEDWPEGVNYSGASIFSPSIE